MGEDGEGGSEQRFKSKNKRGEIWCMLHTCLVLDLRPISVPWANPEVQPLLAARILKKSKWRPRLSHWLFCSRPWRNVCDESLCPEYQAPEQASGI